MSDTHFTRSGSSPGASNDSFVCSGSSPQHRSVRPASRVVLTRSFHSENFHSAVKPSVEERLNSPALVCLRGGR